MKKGIILGYSEIFPGEQVPLIKDLLTGVSKKALIHCLAYLNASLHSDRSIENQVKLFGWFTIHFSKDFNEAIYKKVNEIERDFKSVSFVTYRTILELMQEVLEIAETDSNALELSVEEELLCFKSILLANEGLNSKQKIKNDSKEEEYTDENYFRFLFPNFLSQYDFQLYNMPFVTYTKSIYFFQFAEQDELFKALLLHFYKKNNIDNWRKYSETLLKCYTSILSVKADKTGVILNLVNDAKELESFLDKLCVNKSSPNTTEFQDEQIMDYKIIRERPLYKLAESQYVFLNFNFFIDKLYQGLFFDFKEIIEGLSEEAFANIVQRKLSTSKDKFFNPFKSYFSSNFTEKILFYRTIRNIFIDKKSIHIEDDKQNGLVDYYIRFHNKIFLFEFKDVSMNSKDKHSFDYEIIKEAILSKFSKGKGTTQLINAIEKLSNGNLGFEKRGDRVYPTSQMKIYPIIVFTDYVFSFNGVDRVLDEELKNQLNNSDKIKKTRFKKIYDLSFIHLDFLILLESSFNSSRISFVDILEEYLETVKNLRKKNKYKTFQDFMDKFDSFNEVVSDNLKKKGILPTTPPLLFQEEVKRLVNHN